MPKVKGSALKKTTYYGIYRAKVEDNKDDQGIGRIKIRIPSMHGNPGIDEYYIENEHLPWAQYGASVEGSFIVPDIGSMVFIMFEAGDSSKPVYVGSCYSTNSVLSKVRENDDSTGTHQWNSPSEVNNVPTEASKSSSTKNMKVIYQSPKGAVISMNEDTGKEKLSLVDRLGQALEFNCPVSDDHPEISRRGTNALHSEGRGKVSNTEASVVLTDGAGQSLKMVSTKGKDSSMQLTNYEYDTKLVIGEAIRLAASNGYTISLLDDVKISNADADKTIVLNESGINVTDGVSTISVSTEEESISMKSGSSLIKLVDGRLEVDSDGSKIVISNGQISINPSSGSVIINSNILVHGDILGREI